MSCIVRIHSDLYLSDSTANMWPRAQHIAFINRAEATERMTQTFVLIISQFCKIISGKLFTDGPSLFMKTQRTPLTPLFLNKWTEKVKEHKRHRKWNMENEITIGEDDKLYQLHFIDFMCWQV